MSFDEWAWSVGTSYSDMAVRAYNKEYIPDDIRDALEEEAIKYGMSYSEFITKVGTSE